MARAKKAKDVPAHLPPPDKDPEPVELSFPEAVHRKDKHSNLWLWIILALFLIGALYYLATQGI
jgi:hypothetical protein